MDETKELSMDLPEIDDNMDPINNMSPAKPKKAKTKTKKKVKKKVKKPVVIEEPEPEEVPEEVEPIDEVEEVEEVEEAPKPKPKPKSKPKSKPKKKPTKTKKTTKKRKPEPEPEPTIADVESSDSELEIEIELSDSMEHLKTLLPVDIMTEPEPEPEPEPVVEPEPEPVEFVEPEPVEFVEEEEEDEEPTTPRVIKFSTDTENEPTERTPPGTPRSSPVTDTEEDLPKIKKSVSPDKDFNPFKDDVLYRFLCEYPVPLFNKLAGLVYGCAAAECFGVQADNMNTEYLHERFPDGVNEMPTVQSHGIRPNDWGGNTDQLVVIIDALTETGGDFDLGVFVRKLKKWRKQGFQELGDLTGTGMDQVTSRVTANTDFVRDPIGVSRKTVGDFIGANASNGSVVRGCMLSVSNNWQSVAIQQSMATHANNVSIYSSWLLTSMCRELMRDHLPPPTHFLKNKLAFIKRPHAKLFNESQRVYECKFPVVADGEDLTYERILEEQLKRLDLGTEPHTNALKTIGCAFYALNAIRCVANGHGTKLSYDNIFKETVKAIVNQGGDTDTNAAAAGAVMGSWLSYTNLPSDWVLRFENKRWLDKKLIELFKTMIEK